MDKSNLILFLQEENTKRIDSNVEYIEIENQTMPISYINFANIDLDSDAEHKYINTITNAKRALDGQADLLMKLLGVNQNGKTIGFPKKIEYIQKVGIIAPRILKKINKIRNIVEHEYYQPSQDEAEDYLDIVSLFVLATEKYSAYTPIFTKYTSEYSEIFGMHYFVDIHIDNSASKINVVIDRHKFGFSPQKYSIAIKEPEYFEVLKYCFQKGVYK